jgi:hypothetical protein
LECDAVHALVTEDRGIHVKARLRGIGERDIPFRPPKTGCAACTSPGR